MAGSRKRGRPVKGSGRAVRQGKMAVEIHQNPGDQVIIYSRAPRDPTRSPRATLAQCATSPSPLRSAVRSVTRATPTNSSKLASTVPTNSLNMTEFAKVLKDDTEDDPEEGQSAPDPSFVHVHGYRVKIEIAPLLKKIFNKYCDITKESNLKSSSIVSFAFERLCDIITRLEGTTFRDVSHIVLDEMLDEVRFFEEHGKLNVGWLLERLKCISEAKAGAQQYLRIKEDEANYDASVASLDKELEGYRNELSQLEQKISATEGELIAAKVNVQQSRNTALEIRTKVDPFKKHTLVHGLL